MKRIFFLIMVVSLLASMLLISTATAEYQPGAPAKFGIKLPDGSRFMNVTPPTYDIGDKFNITVEIQNVANMSAYGVTILWNSTFCNATGNWWLSDFFEGERVAGRWSVASVGYVGNDLRTQPGKEALPPHIGAFVGLGQTAMGLQYFVTGDFDIVKIEFRVNSYGPSWFYVWKEPDNDPNYPSQPYAWAGLSKESLFPEALHPTHSGYISLPYPGYKQPYDVFWAPGYENVTNALLVVYQQPPYDVTIKAHCYTESMDVSASITMDGSPTGFNTPHTFTGLTGTHNFTVPNTDPNEHPFKQWNTSETSTTITVTTGGTYTAYYQAKYNLTITTTTGGTTNPSPGTYSYWNGTSVSVTAIPDANYVFEHWELDTAWNYSNPISVTMDSDHTLHAVFIPIYDVTIRAYCYNERAYVSASITMDGSPTGYTTPHTFTGLNGTHLFTVPSTDLQGHPFTQWSTGETSTTITVSSAGTYTAYYGERPPVGGIWVPVDKLGLLAPYVALASTILVATVATAIYVKRRKKKQ